MTLLYFNILLFIQFLVYSSYIFDIVMIGDENIHMIIKRLVQFSSGLGGAYYVGMVPRYYIYPWILPGVPRPVVDRKSDNPIESSLVHPPYVGFSRARSRER